MDCAGGETKEQFAHFPAISDYTGNRKKGVAISPETHALLTFHNSYLRREKIMEIIDTDNLFERIRFRGNPQANPHSVITSGQARFTILTGRLVRMEWSESGEFEDRSTYAFPTRFAPVPDHRADIEGEQLVIRAPAFELRYRQASGKFGPENLSIDFDFNGNQVHWTPGILNPQNLRGTRRTLDNCNREAALDEGLLARSGWTLFDDSRSVVFRPNDGWVAPRPQDELQDWYFACYGHDYKKALADYLQFGGPVPLIPRFVLGAWWSRFWAYSAQDLQDLVQDFEAHDLPLDVLVVDMDWHTPHAWTGYTWNRELFPDPAGFLSWVHARGLRTTFNLHPAQGVQAFEAIYPRFAEAMGIDPASGQVVPFRITDKKFVQHYFELLHHPMEAEGVDFWWIDWQQGDVTEMKGLDALPWLNHLHFHDSTRRGQRPMLYSRWGGLGNHRYPIGFSGDTLATWRSLQFQPYFTATASNVAYGWWSHDIGGHMGGETEPELYARWVQFGALSPCLRLHSTKDERCERRPWIYPEPVYQAARAAFHLRYKLIPYLYTMARIASDTGIALCRPMYYEYPAEEPANVARSQFFLGDQMIVAPIVSRADPATGLASVDVWLPEGTWIDFMTRMQFTGPRWVRLTGDLNYIPMLVKAGAIVPLAASFGPQPAPRLASGTVDALPRDRLVLLIFPGPTGEFRLYEDDGQTLAYQNGEYEWTRITTVMTGPDDWEVVIGAVEGRCAALPEQRSYEIRLAGSHCPEGVLVNGAGFSEWFYLPESQTTVIPLPPSSKSRPVRVRGYGKRLSALGEARNWECLQSDVQKLLGEDYPPGAQDSETLLNAALRSPSPGRATAIARLGGPFVRVEEFVTPEDALQQLGRVIVGAPVSENEPYDLEIEFTLERQDSAERFTTRLAKAIHSQIIDTPFAFDNQARAQRWKAAIQLNWRGQTLTSTYQSTLLFATIYKYQAHYYDAAVKPLSIKAVLDAHGRPNPALDWVRYEQSPHGLVNLVEPYGINFFEACETRLAAGHSMAVYLAATVISPDERGAVLFFLAGGEPEIFLNGKKCTRAFQSAGDLISDFTDPSMAGDVLKLDGLTLHPGENTLVIHSRPDVKDPSFWVFGGALASPQGQWMPDLEYQGL